MNDTLLRFTHSFTKRESRTDLGRDAQVTVHGEGNGHGDSERIVTDGGTNQKPDAPENIPQYLRDGVKRQDVATLRDLAAYAERLADHKERQADRDLQEAAIDEDMPDEWDDEEWNDQIEDARDKGDVPAGKGTVTVKQIDGRGYYYLQWREGEDIRSQYIAPVNPSD